MVDGGRRGGPLRGLRIAFRIVLGVALLLLLIANGVKQAPRLVALVAAHPGPSAVAASSAEPPSSAAPVATSELPSATPSSIPSATVSLPATGTGGAATPKPRPRITPSVTSTTTPQARITALSVDNGTASCPAASEVTVHWTSTGYSGDGYFGIDTSDAKNAPYSTTHPTDSITVNFPCSERQQVYTVTVLSPDGTHVSRSITVKNLGTSG